MKMRLVKVLIVALLLGLALALSAAAYAGMKKFTNSAPAFSVSYPASMSKKPPKGKEVLRVTAPMGLPALTASIRPLEKEIPLDGALKIYTQVLAKLGTEVKVVSSEKFKVDGVDAIKAKVTWKHGGVMSMTTLNRIFIKDRKLVFVSTHTIGKLKAMEAILNTLRIK